MYRNRFFYTGAVAGRGRGMWVTFFFSESLLAHRYRKLSLTLSTPDVEASPIRKCNRLVAVSRPCVYSTTVLLLYFRVLHFWRFCVCSAAT